MKANLICSAFILCSLFLHAQNVEYQWSNRIGDNYNAASDMVIDAQGCVYTVGFHYDVCDFDPGPAVQNLSGPQAYLTKTNPQGSLVWATLLGEAGSIQPSKMVLDPNGYVIVTGSFGGTIDFDPGPGTSVWTASWNDAFISKFDTTGNFLWAKGFGGGFSDVGVDVCVDDSSNIYSIGEFEGLVDFDPGAGTYNITDNGNQDIYVQKLNANGDFMWAVNFGNNTDNYCSSMAINSNNEILIMGAFWATMDVDPGIGQFNVSSPSSAQSLYITKLNSNGVFVDAVAKGDGFISFITERINLVTDASDNIYISGAFGNTLSFDTGTGNIDFVTGGSSNTDCFLLKLAPDWSYEWAKHWGGTTGDEFLHATAVDNSGNIYNLGRMSGIANMNPNGTFNLSNYSTGFFLQKLDNNGDFKWAFKLNGDFTTNGRAIVLDDQHNIYVAGYFVDGTTDFDPTAATQNMTVIGQTNTFLVKYEQCEAVSYDVVNACQSYTWMDGNTYFSDNNTATYTIPNGAASGCDSVVVLQLTVQEVDTSVIQIGPVLTAGFDPIAFQWLDCNNNYAPIAGATGQTYIATAVGSYAVQVTQNGCIDTSACYTVNALGLKSIDFASVGTLYPNPTKRYLNVQLNLPDQTVGYRIVDELGRLIYSGTESSSFVADMGDHSGYFILELQTSLGTFRKPFICY